RSMGTLGGGNHFIEIGRSADGTFYLVIHTGSRNLGKQVAEIYQRLAIDLAKGKDKYFAQRDEIIAVYKSLGRKTEIKSKLAELEKEYRGLKASMPDDLCYVHGKYFHRYLHDMELCQEFARRNRELIAKILLGKAGLTGVDAFHTIHNYIDVGELIIRKGAIAAHKGERVLIPINMRDDSVLAVGKGNADWNFSAPHGAGRIFSRSDAKERLDMDEYRAAMAGIYTTSVSAGTLDESPMAYKSLDDIIDVIGDTVDIVEVMKPVYNFKAEA
ncbi:MAG: RtcB family protein, partial [Selenomonadaceae bacterium]|nr:RtcB family protein [Selenomonadaceae bacterium]